MTLLHSVAILCPKNKSFECKKMQAFNFTNKLQLSQTNENRLCLLKGNVLIKCSTFEMCHQLNIRALDTATVDTLSLIGL